MTFESSWSAFIKVLTGRSHREVGLGVDETSDQSGLQGPWNEGREVAVAEKCAARCVRGLLVDF